MEAFTKLTSKVVPLPAKDVDTDQIIPAQYMTSISKEGYGQNLFRRLKEQDPNFPLNLDKFKDAKIIIADNNFGCGSSREHAVWALMSGGFKAIIAKDFADIFYNNSAKNGLMLVSLPEDVIDRILEESTDGKYKVTIDLENQVVTLNDDSTYKFDYDPFRKHCLLNGLDDIDYILSEKDKITAYQNENKLNFSTTSLAKG